MRGPTAPAELGLSGEKQRDLRQLERSYRKGEPKPRLTPRPGDAGTRLLLLATNTGATTAPARLIRSGHRCQHRADEEELSLAKTDRKITTAHAPGT